MQISGHLKAAPILSVLLITGEVNGVIIAVFASLLIDLDHIHLVIREKAFSFQKIIKISENIYDPESLKRCFMDVTYALHSLEVNLLLLALSFYFPILLYVVAGFSLHIACDMIHHHKLGLPIISWFILTTYFVRLIKKTSFRTTNCLEQKTSF